MAAEEMQGITTLTIDQVKDRMIEPGRICQIVWGEHYRKLVAIVEFIDRTRVLVDGGNGALSDYGRNSMPMRRIQVTKFRIPLSRGASSDDVAEGATKYNVVELWKKSAAGRRNECIQRREQLNDFGRFKLYFIRQKFRNTVNGELHKLRAEAMGISPQELRDRQTRRRAQHPVLTRVTGKFRRRLQRRVIAKALDRKKRLLGMGHRIQKLQADARKRKQRM